jgi:hypothetical protein
MASESPNQRNGEFKFGVPARDRTVANVTRVALDTRLRDSM